MKDSIIQTILTSLSYSRQRIQEHDHSGLSGYRRQMTNPKAFGIAVDEKLDDATISRMWEEGKKIKQMSLTPIDEAIAAMREIRDAQKKERKHESPNQGPEA